MPAGEVGFCGDGLPLWKKWVFRNARGGAKIAGQGDQLRENAMSIAISSPSASPVFTSPFTTSAAGNSSAETGTPGSEVSSSSSVEAEFLKFAQMTPEERVQKAILSKLGMTEEEFNKLDAKAKGDVLTKIRDEILRQADMKSEQRTGAVADIRV
jgi:hypothetical protein